MGGFNFIPTDIAGLTIVEPVLHGDERGYFMETWQASDFAAAGIQADFVQDNQSGSRRGVLRGLHYQRQHPQAKLVRVLAGEVYDVAVDLRPDSPTCGKHFGLILSAANRRQLFVPRGLAHGFLVLSDTAVFAYKCDEFYHPEDEGGLAWNDPTIGIAWPLAAGEEPILSDKDRANPLLEACQLKGTV